MGVVFGNPHKVVNHSRRTCEVRVFAFDFGDVDTPPSDAKDVLDVVCDIMRWEARGDQCPQADMPFVLPVHDRGLSDSLSLAPSGTERDTVAPHLEGALARLDADTEERLLWGIVAAVGALVAWPVSGGGVEVAVLVCALVAGVLLPVVAPERMGRTYQSTAAVGMMGLTAMSIAQRIDEPAHGLVALVTAAALVIRIRQPVESRGPPSMLLTLLISGLQLAVPNSLPISATFPTLALLVLGGALFVARMSSGQTTGLFEAIDFILAAPARVLVFVFSVLCSIGTLLLLLPAATTAPGSIHAVDAAFTAVSAVCVTGLIVLDTPVDFTLFGQALVLVFIQLGGLGIMAFASIAVITMGRRLGVREERLTAELIGGDDARRYFDSSLGIVLAVTFVTELVGALLLAPMFWWMGDSVPTAIWRAVFTSISAFCNAGFALQSDSLVSYATQPFVLLVISGLIIVGGTGPLVVATAVLRRRFSLHHRLVIWTTACLLVVPAFLFLAFEWNGVLAPFDWIDKLTNAFFQSVTLRTAGFNSIDFGAIGPAAWTLSIVCMFIGASPGSTGGGVKTTTIVVQLLSVLASIRGHDDVLAFGRRISPRTIREASAITALGIVSVIGALWALQLTQAIPLDRLLFEVVSALGTAGISMGATASLDNVGKVIVILCMFAGRIGPLTLFMFLLGREESTPQVPIEPVQVG